MPRSDGSGRVLLIGANGYIGSHILNALLALYVPSLRILVRSNGPVLATDGVEVVVGSITCRRALVRAMDGVSCVINAASYVGADPVLLKQTYDDGVRNIIDACAEYQVDRLIHLSTTAVYGSGPHAGVSATELPYSPESPTSTVRALSDELVLAAGGSTVRPHLVIGKGDRWVAPALRKMTEILGGLIDGGAALQSVINVRDLGELIAALALSRDAVQGPIHAAYRQPVRAADLIRFLAPDEHAAAFDHNVSLERALKSLTPHGFTAHQVRMIGETHWYQSNDIWDIASPFLPQSLSQFDGVTLDPQGVHTEPDLPLEEHPVGTPPVPPTMGHLAPSRNQNSAP